MPDLFLERHVPHLPKSMFELVADLESYPRFVPNCKAMDVKPNGGRGKLAKMTIQFGPVTQAYTSEVTADPQAMTIIAKSDDGPFKFLDSKWSFEPEGQGTRITFDIDFKISNPLLAAVAEPAFAAKQDEIIDAFVAEADRRFG
ncbi:type II toxin-antitoxin system RatA family toxin [Devosia sp.]|uniref:type II toxin-antitoxin system RatA family toxin n=1 Tax=Devosia sp. TaxID=1871048 RepID=UPI003A8EAD9A